MPSVPVTPTVQLIADSAGGAIVVAITNPPPRSHEPLEEVAVYNDVYRRTAVTDAVGIRVAADVSVDDDWADHTVASGVDYSYRALAYGASGASTSSDWASTTTAADTDNFPSLTHFPSLTTFPGA